MSRFILFVLMLLFACCAGTGNPGTENLGRPATGLYSRPGPNYLHEFNPKHKYLYAKVPRVVGGSVRSPNSDLYAAPMRRLPDNLKNRLVSIQSKRISGIVYVYAILETCDPRLERQFTHEIEIGASTDDLGKIPSYEKLP